MKKLAGVVAVVAMAVGTTGCLQKETTHTVYLSQDGGARWVVQESGVHSDEADPGARIAEEQAFIGPVLIGGGRMAQAFQAIGPDGLVRTTVIRDERPFHVITEAPFASVDRLFQKLFKEAGLHATVTLSRDGDRSSLRMRFDFTGEIEERETAVTALLEDVGHLTFVLSEGEFVAGGGFEVPNRLSAKISAEALANIEKAVEARSEMTLVLAWRR